MGCGTSKMTNSLPHHTLEDSENRSPSNSDGGPRKRPRLFSARRLSQSTDALRFSFGSQTDRGRRDSFSDKRTLGLSPSPSLGFACKKGLKPVSPNQDSFFIARHDSTFAFGVFDGHGRHGHDVSHLVKTRLSDPLFLRRLARLDQVALARAIKDEFTAIQDLLIRETRLGNLDASASGTTATLVLRHGNLITTAWLGDSRAILCHVTPDRSSTGQCSSNDGNVVVNEVVVDRVVVNEVVVNRVVVNEVVVNEVVDKVRVQELSEDHKPNIPEERARVEAGGGVVIKPPHDVNYRVYVKNQKFPGLAMSRALGDLVGHFNAGISCEPEISTVEISDHTHVVVCSDGVWEFIDSAECGELVRKFLAVGDEAEAAENLAKEAYDRWIKEEGGMVVDDVTVIIAKL